MDEQLRKRLEEAARKEIPDILRVNGNYVESFITGFCFGDEFMFKECGGMTVLHDMRRLILAQCKAWLKDNAQPKYIYIEGNEGMCIDNAKLLADFEVDMNKLWKEKK